MCYLAIMAVPSLFLAAVVTDTKRAEKQLQDTLESLRKAVGATIQVITPAIKHVNLMRHKQPLDD